MWTGWLGALITSRPVPATASVARALDARAIKLFCDLLFHILCGTRLAEHYPEFGIFSCEAEEHSLDARLRVDEAWAVEWGRTRSTSTMVRCSAMWWRWLWRTCATTTSTRFSSPFYAFLLCKNTCNEVDCAFGFGQFGWVLALWWSSASVASHQEATLKGVIRMLIIYRFEDELSCLLWDLSVGRLEVFELLSPEV